MFTPAREEHGGTTVLRRKPMAACCMESVGEKAAKAAGLWTRITQTLYEEPAAASAAASPKLKQRGCERNLMRDLVKQTVVLVRTHGAAGRTERRLNQGREILIRSGPGGYCARIDGFGEEKQGG